MDNALDQLRAVAARGLNPKTSVTAGQAGPITFITALQTTPSEAPVKHTVHVQKLRVVVTTGAAGVTWTFSDSNGAAVGVGTPGLDMSTAGAIYVFDFGPTGAALTLNKNLIGTFSGAGAAADVFVEGYQEPYMAVNNGIPGFVSIAPVSGAAAGGVAVAVFGTGFRRGAGITLGGVACTSVQWISPQELLAVSGAHAAGAVDVVVTNPAPNGSETVTGAGAFTYV